MSNSGLTELSPCCCSGAVLSFLLSPWPGVKDCPCLCETRKAQWDSGMKASTVRLWWAQGSWELRENRALRKGAPLPAESQQSRGPSSLQLAPHWRMSLWPGWGFREVQISKGKKHFTSLRQHQPTIIHVSCCQHMKNSNEIQRLEVWQWGSSAAH